MPVFGQPQFQPQQSQPWRALPVTYPASAPSSSDPTITGPLTTATDDFNRADNASTLGRTPVGGLTWGYMTGTTWGISGNQAYQPVGAGFATVDTGSPNGTVVSTFVTANTFQGLCVRQLNDSQYFTVERGLLRRVNTAGTIIASWGSAVAGDVLSVEMNGDDFTVFINGVNVFGSGVVAATDSFNNTVTRHGIADLGPNPSSRWDDWSWTALPPVGRGWVVGAIAMN